MEDAGPGSWGTGYGVQGTGSGVPGYGAPGCGKRRVWKTRSLENSGSSGKRGVWWKTRGLRGKRGVYVENTGSKWKTRGKRGGGKMRDPGNEVAQFYRKSLLRTDRLH